jgi:hypothetical protein
VYTCSDGKDDYAYIDEAGALWLWYNRGVANDSMGVDGLRFADIDGDGVRSFSQTALGQYSHSFDSTTITSGLTLFPGRPRSSKFFADVTSYALCMPWQLTNKSKQRWADIWRCFGMGMECIEWREAYCFRRGSSLQSPVRRHQRVSNTSRLVTLQCLLLALYNTDL